MWYPMDFMGLVLVDPLSSQQVVAPGWTDHGHLVVTILEKCRQEIMLLHVSHMLHL